MSFLGQVLPPPLEVEPVRDTQLPKPAPVHPSVHPLSLACGTDPGLNRPPTSMASQKPQGTAGQSPEEENEALENKLQEMKYYPRGRQ